MKEVSLLLKLLMDSSFENILSFLHQTKVQWYLTKNKRGVYRSTIWVEGKTLKYQGSSTKSARVALLNPLARFLTKENKDYHEYLD